MIIDTETQSVDVALMQKALIVIDALCLGNVDALDDPDHPNNEFVSAVYKISHAAHQTCGNDHESWVEYLHKLADELEQTSLIKDIDSKLTV